MRIKARGGGSSSPFWPLCLLQSVSESFVNCTFKGCYRGKIFESWNDIDNFLFKKWQLLFHKVLPQSFIKMVLMNVCIYNGALWYNLGGALDSRSCHQSSSKLSKPNDPAATVRIPAYYENGDDRVNDDNSNGGWVSLLKLLLVSILLPTKILIWEHWNVHIVWWPS